MLARGCCSSPPAVPGTALVDLWRSESVPLRTDVADDPTSGDFQLMPAGALFRIIDLAPTGDAEPMWHRTDSVDFVDVASGTATALFEGGTLLVGVADDGTVHGLESDYASRSATGQDPRDWFQQHLANIVAASMGEAAATNVRPRIHHVDGHDLCRVQVDPAGFPVDATVVYQKPNEPKETRTELFVRVANGTRAVDGVAGEVRCAALGRVPPAERWCYDVAHVGSRYPGVEAERVGSGRRGGGRRDGHDHRSRPPGRTAHCDPHVAAPSADRRGTGPDRSPPSVGAVPADCRAEPVRRAAGDARRRAVLRWSPTSTPLRW